MPKASKALRTSPARLNAILTGAKSPERTKVLQSIAARLPVAIRLYAKLDHDRRAELEGLEKRVAIDGLRATARQLGIDPSNLRRRLGDLGHSRNGIP